MARDFTVSAYLRLLSSLRNAGYAFQPLRDFIRSPEEKVVILRHDVDREPINSLRTALAEHEMDICGTYFFRCKEGKFEEEIIRQINRIGHEVGYHYEDLSKVKGERRKEKVASQKSKIKSQKLWSFGNIDEAELASTAYDTFRVNLEMLRKIVPVSNICMHGSPISRYDSRLLWKYYDYRELGVTAEPYFDICFEDILYLTDTGRRWDGASVSLRDRNRGYVYNNTEYFNGWKVKPVNGSLMNMTTRAGELQSGFTFRSTYNIISSVITGNMPRKIMMTVHPQRWNDRLLSWSKELLLQKFKNPVKYFLVRAANRG